MKLRFLAAIAIWAGVGVYAQTASKSYSLQQCVDYAITNNVSVKNATLDEYIAKAKVGEVRATGLPQINGSLQVLDNPTLQRQFLSASNPLLAAYGYPVGPAGSVDALPNLFQLRTTSTPSITVNQMIFDGSYIIGLQAAKTYRELAHKTTQQSRIQTITNVRKAYYLVLISNERLNLLHANIGNLDTSLAQTRALYASGFVEKIDVSRIEVAYNNLLSERERTSNMAKMSMVTLKFQMGMPVNEEIVLEGKISDMQINDIPSKADMAYANRIEYSLLETQKDAQKLDLKNNRIGFAPRLSAFGNLGYYTANLDVTKIPSSPYYQYSNVGLSLTVPIFDGLGKSYRIQQSKYKIQQIENNLQSMKNTIDYQIASAEISFANARKSLEIQKKNMELASEVQRVSQLKYQQGVGSSLEVVNAETSYKEAQTNYYSALYDAVVAKVDYDKALGNLK